MNSRFSTGASYLLDGFRLLWRRDILPWVIAPIAINLLVFVALAGSVFHWIGSFAATIHSWLPDWLAFLEWIFWLIAGLLAIVVAAYAFVLLANLVAAPFNSVLAEKVAASLGLAPAHPPPGLLAQIASSIARELRKLLYFLPRAAGVLLLSLIPPVNSVSPFLWFAFGAWSLALEYSDFGAETAQVSFQDLRRRARTERGTFLGFGSAAMIATMIPLLNLVAMPAAVCGGVLLWKDFSLRSK